MEKEIQGSPRQVKMSAQQFSGPIPPPAFLEHYEKIVPGAAERILRMAEKAADSEIATEKEKLRLLNKELNLHGWGQLTSTAIMGCGFAFGTYAIYKEENMAAVASYASSLAIIVGTIIRKKTEKE